MVKEGAIYESDVTGELVEVVGAFDPFSGADPDNQTVEIEGVEDGEWRSEFADNFRKNYSRIAADRTSL